MSEWRDVSYDDEDEWQEVSYESESKGEEPSWLDVAKDTGLAVYQGLENTGRDVEKALLGGADWALDSVPFLDIDTPLDDVYWKRRKQQDAATNEFVDPYSAYADVSNVTRGLVPSVVSYLATRSPQVAAAVPAAFGSVDEYQEGRKRGEGWGEATTKGLEKLGVDYALNRLEISPALNSKLNPLARIALSSGTGTVGNVLSEANNLLLDYFSNEDTSNWRDRLEKAGKIGAATGGFFSGAVEGARALGGNVTPLGGVDQSRVDYYADIAASADEAPQINFAEPQLDSVRPGVEQVPNIDPNTPVDSGFMVTTPEGPMDLSAYLEQQGIKNNLIEPGVPAFLERQPELPKFVDNLADAQVTFRPGEGPVPQAEGAYSTASNPYLRQNQKILPSDAPLVEPPDQQLAAEIARYQDAKLLRDAEIQDGVLGNRTMDAQGIIPESDIPLVDGSPVVDPTALTLPSPKRPPLIEQVRPSNIKVPEQPRTTEQAVQRLAELGFVDAPKDIIQPQPDPILEPFTNRGNIRKILDPRIQEIAETVRREQDERIQRSMAQEVRDAEAERLVRGDEILSKKPVEFERVAPAADFAEPGNKIVSPEVPMPPSVVMRRPDIGTSVIIPDDPGYRARDAQYQSEMLQMREVVRLVVEPEPRPLLATGERGKIRRNPQRGALRIPFSDLIETLRDKPADNTIGFDEYEGSGFFPKVPATARKIFEMPITLKERFPNLPEVDVPYQQHVVERPAYYNTAIGKFRKSMAPYLDAPEAVRTDANHVLAGWRKAAHQAKLEGKAVPVISPEALARVGIRGEIANAVVAVNQTMDLALTHFEDAMAKTILNADTEPKTKAQNMKRLTEYVGSLRNSNYVPFGRYGKWVVSGLKADGKRHVSFHESKFEASKLKRKLNSEGGKFEYKAFETIPDSFYEDMPHDVVGFMSLLKGEKGELPPRGIAANFIEAELIDGYDTNFTRSISRYLHGIANLHARANTDVHINQAMKSLKEKAPYVYDRLSKYNRFMNKPGNPWAARYQKANSFMFLAGSEANATLNGLEPIITTYPQIGHYVKGVFTPEVIMGKAAAKYALLPTKWIAPDVWKKIDPDLASAIEMSSQRGFLDESTMREFQSLGEGLAPSPKWLQTIQKNTPQSISQFAEAAANLPEKPASTILGVPGMLQTVVENNVKIFDYIVGVEIARKNGLKGIDAVKFAEYFVTDIKSSGNRGTQNTLMGRIPVVSPIISTFKNFVANGLRLLGRSIKDARRGNPGPLVRSAIATFGVAGVMAIPGMRYLISTINQGDEDPKQTVRRYFPGESGDLVLYGLSPFFTDTVITDSLNLANSIPDIERDWKGALATTLVGPLGNYAITKVPFALELYKNNRSDLALEQLSPRFMRDKLRASRYDRQGYTDARGNVIMDRSEITDSDISKVSKGFKSLSFAKKAEENELSRSLEEKETKNSKAAYDKIFEALTGSGTKSIEQLVEDEPELIEFIAADGFERAMSYREGARANKPLQRLMQLSPESLERFIKGRDAIYGALEEN